MIRRGPGPRNGGRRVAGEQGSATVWMVAVIMVLLVAFLFVFYTAGVMLARHRAESAADLAALAAAQQADAGPPAACARARRLTDRMRVALTGCLIRGWEAYIEVDAPLPADLRRFGVVHAHARAGPAPGPNG